MYLFNMAWHLQGCLWIVRTREDGSGVVAAKARLGGGCSSCLSKALLLSAVCTKLSFVGFGFAFMHSNFQTVLQPFCLPILEGHKDSGATCLGHFSQGQNIHMLCPFLSDAYICKHPLDHFSAAIWPTTLLYVLCHTVKQKEKCGYSSIKRQLSKGRKKTEASTALFSPAFACKHQIRLL